MHLKRWLTGIISLPVLIYVIGFAPRWIFYAMLFLASVIGLTEFYRITAPELSVRIKSCGYLVTLAIFIVTMAGSLYLLPAVIVLMVFIIMTLLVVLPYSPGTHTAGDIGRGLFGPLYLALPLSMLMVMDRYPQGSMWIFFLLTVIFASDTGAFYFGKIFGKHKLHKIISPGKTWEGAVGGLLSSIIASIWFLSLTQLKQVNLRLILLAGCLSIAGQIGDLSESLLKRGSGIKDSGRILPGHGGLLDRIDGLLFAVPILYIYFY